MPFVAKVEERAPAAPAEAPVLAVHLLGRCASPSTGRR
jgi:hypothetical protein